FLLSAPATRRAASALDPSRPNAPRPRALRFASFLGATATRRATLTSPCAPQAQPIPSDDLRLTQLPRRRNQTPPTSSDPPCPPDRRRSPSVPPPPPSP